jgi:hypothetical protein
MLTTTFMAGFIGVTQFTNQSLIDANVSDTPGVVKGGTGQLLASNTPPAALINQSTFQGGGAMGDSGLTITNQGTINANDVSSNLVVAGTPLTNSSQMEATGGGTLEIRNTVNNTGATIEAQTAP